MIEHINLHPAYVTTSSCSGRIALFLEDAEIKRQRSKGGRWLLCLHSKVRKEDVTNALALAQSSCGFVFFKTEPFIMHVQCRSLDDACRLLEVAKASGYRESGIYPGYALHES
jgi:tRNA wybutosine-synthesizing protein 3